MINIEEVKVLLDGGRADDALALFDGAGNLNAYEYFWRGKVNWRLGNRREAINDYHASVERDASGPALQALQQAYDVMQFFNPDMLNP